jgi:hypothetical protein
LARGRQAETVGRDLASCRQPTKQPSTQQGKASKSSITTPLSI